MEQDRTNDIGLDEPAGGSDLDFEQAVEAFYDALYQFAFRLTGKASDAADLTQETYQVLLLKCREIRNPRKLRPWLFTTLYRQFLRGRAHLGRFPEVELEVAAAELPTISPAQVEDLDAGLVREALQQLEPKYRVPVALFYLEDMSYKEIAEMLGVPIGTVMSRLSRGKLALRQRLATLFTDDAPGPRSTTVITTTPSKRAKPGELPQIRFQEHLNAVSRLASAAI